ncbi:sugar kinase [Streptomyces spinoverrucosus]|uniref:sugar kinase n=1 Tax=Streptomyces spinoverrucosus TaxID=284043 RepID=UPI0018C4435B|nr:sugar kinase [Streptomyces spinoverrucosus]MBG0852858.1 sugar kinase [Streptomyces spinoverrucosus]
MTATGASNAPDIVDVVALGESMVTFLPSRPGRLADVPSFDRGIGGAESNVACVMAAAGHTTRWVSRVGADGFGDHLVEAIGAYGVDVSSVRRDPARPTGVYFRTAGDRAGDGHEVAYYRAGSAASAMSVTNVDVAAARAGRVLHLSGITAALSGDCLELMRELTAPAAGRPLVSFDVNHRPGLWRKTDGSRVLLELARGADIVFVGEDEAEAAWGVQGGPEAIRELLPEPEMLVVKQGAEGATAFEREPEPEHRDRPAAGRGGPVAQFPTPLRSAQPGPVLEPAPRVSVVAPVGAGDAFAAGFLSGTLRGLSLRARLRHGHLWAAAALTVPGDLAPPPSRAHADRLAALDDEAWGTLRLGPGWTHAVDRAPEEVRTP